MPGWPAYQRFLADLKAAQGEFELARQLMADMYPELLEDPLDPDWIKQHLVVARNFAAILSATGELQRCDILLSALEEQIALLHRLRGDSYGILDVYIHAMRGDSDRAIEGLREAIGVGWKTARPFPLDGNWWTLRQDWKLANLHNDPEFTALMDELEAEVDKQRQWYEENKDKPLF